MAAKQIGTMSPGELAGFFGQLAMLVRAGISSEEALRLLRDDTQSQPERELLDRLLAPAERGEPLSAAMREAGGFPSYAVNMIEIGEQSGRLDEVLGSLASYYEREDSLGSMLKSAVTYPLIMLGMMLLVILVLSVKVLPIFTQVFASSAPICPRSLSARCSSAAPSKPAASFWWRSSPCCWLRRWHCAPPKEAGTPLSGFSQPCRRPAGFR